MKQKFKKWLYPIVGLGLLSILIVSCKKEDSPIPSTVTDIDGNSYHTTIIGTQVWLVENLKVTKYNDGTDIPLWANNFSPGYCWYNSDQSNFNTYGALYNWYAVNTKKICPKGWHVPSEEEWQTLTLYLGGAKTAAYKLKESGTEHWNSPNDGATNETGFTALPGGYNASSGFILIGSNGLWWSSTEYNIFPSNAIVRGMDFYGGLVRYSHAPYSWLLSVRCIKD